jgi:hypothetical protein
MHFLNELYQTFDELVDDYGMYKLDIVGDCYIVVAGLIKEDQVWEVWECMWEVWECIHSLHAIPLHSLPSTPLYPRCLNLSSTPLVLTFLHLPSTSLPHPHCLYPRTALCAWMTWMRTR